VIDLNEQAVVREIVAAWLSWHERHMEVPAAELPHVRYAEIAAKALEGQAAELRAARELIAALREVHYLPTMRVEKAVAAYDRAVIP
jgi:hypothetical protein